MLEAALGVYCSLASTKPVWLLELRTSTSVVSGVYIVIVNWSMHTCLSPTIDLHPFSWLRRGSFRPLHPTTNPRNDADMPSIGQASARWKDASKASSDLELRSSWCRVGVAGSCWELLGVAGNKLTGHRCLMVRNGIFRMFHDYLGIRYLSSLNHSTSMAITYHIIS